MHHHDHHDTKSNHDTTSTSNPATQLSAPPGLRIASTPQRGRGVYATRTFAPGELIERAPVLVFDRQLAGKLRGTLLDDYWFWWDEHHRAAALGCGSLYNHTCPANATFTLEPATRSIAIVAVRPIAADDEITINYHGDPDDPSPVWFALGN